MAFWGMDLNQSDEFCEIYNEYMDLYDIGIDPTAITQQILSRYCFENILHNVLFAIAKAEWDLGFRSESVFLKVNQIIDNRENITYYQSLGFSEQDINERSKKLLCFQALLQTSPKAPKKRKISACNRLKRLPKGTVSYYEADDGYYGFVVLDAVYEGRLLAITEKLSVVPKNIEDVLNATALTAIWLLLRKVPKGNHDIGIIKVQEDYNGRAGVYLCQPVSFGINFSFYLDECHQRGLLHFKDHKVHDLLDENNVPIEFYCEETAKEETRMVIDLMNNPASKIATNMIRHAINLEGFFH